jgi:dTDP-glucose pyrophosphorylase
VSEKSAIDSSSKWRLSLLPMGSTLQQAIRTLDATAMQIVIVIDEQGRMVGTITDGDVRRGLLRGLDLGSQVDQIIRPDPIVVPPEFGRDAVLQLMQANRIHHLPVVDEHRQVVGLHVLDEMMAPSDRPNMMVIMAGGKGTRLRPHTENCPKPLLPVAGKPMLEHIIERARIDGFRHFVLSVNYLGHMIEDYFADGSRWQVSIDYLHEPSPLGTVGSIGLLASLPDAPFVVTNGDVLTDIRYGDLLDFHVRQKADATMAVRLHEWQHPFGVVRLRGIEISGFEEKPIARSHINAGVYVLEPQTLECLVPGEPCDMPTLFERVQAGGGRAIVYPMHEPWLDVGRAEDYAAANGG